MRLIGRSARLLAGTRPFEHELLAAFFVRSSKTPVDLWL
jgi:hypothetical protein